MSNELVPNLNQALQPQPLGGGAVVSRRTQRHLRQIGERALTQAADVQATAFVADTAMTYTAMTTLSELHWSRELPDYAYRFRRIGDIQAMAAARSVQEMG
ncbi:MAG: hypothetical protein R2707_16465 [Acidimicrobiales bacterium]